MRSPILRPTTVALLSLALGAGCSADRIMDLPVVSVDSLAALETDEADPVAGYSVLDLETPDNSHQTVHPDFAIMPDWTPRRFLVATPYTYSSNSLENPTLYSRPTGGEWALHGTKNPLARSRSGYLSDPDIVALSEEHELWVYYREVTDRNTIWLIRSKNGLDWDEPQSVVSVPNHMAISPAVVHRNEHGWMMWSVNAGKPGCNGPETTVELRRSADGINWSHPSTVDLAQGNFKVWHIDVQWIASRNEYWAIYNVKRGGTCRTDLLFLATSQNGTSWKTYPSPLLRAGDIPEFADIVYRSTFSYNPRSDDIRFWFSGATYEGGDYVWATVSQRRSRKGVFAAIAAPPAEPFKMRRGREAPPLINPP